MRLESRRPRRNHDDKTWFQESFPKTKHSLVIYEEEMAVSLITMAT